MNKTILKYGGIVAIAIGSIALFVSGVNESSVIEIVAGIFVVAGIVAEIIKDKI